MFDMMRVCFITTCIFLYVMGCAVNLTQRSDYLGIAKGHIDSKNWEAAYRFLEDVPEKDVPKAKILMDNNPQILHAGFSTFAPFSLQSSIAKYGIAESYDIELRRLGYLSRYAPGNEFMMAKNNILSLYDESEIQKAIEEKTKEWTRVEYGRIADIQVADESRYNKGVGAAIGQAYGSATYVDKAFSGSNWNYSAVQHTNAALLGALIGHIVEGDTEIDYHVRYWITLTTGESISIGSHQVSRFHIPKGTCVKVKRRAFIETANQGFCEQSLPTGGG